MAPPFHWAVGWLTPRRSYVHTYTNTHAALLERPLTVDEARASVFVLLARCAAGGCGGLVAPHPYGGEGEPPPQ